MAAPIRLYLDFASPYSYLLLRPLARLAERHGRTLEIRPFLVWAVLKQHEIGNPLEKPARRAYFLQDVVRSAAFFGVPLRLPEPLQISAHLAARLFHAKAGNAPETALALATEIFEAFFVDGANIADPAILAALPSLADEAPEAVREMIEGPVGRQRLAAAVEEAIADGVIGAPFVTLDGEGFFGADRLPQIAWRLENSRTAGAAGPSTEQGGGSSAS